MAQKNAKPHVRGIRGVGALVTGVPIADVRKALRLLERKQSSECKDPRVKPALKLHAVVERFFKQGGRFRRPYTHKKK